MVKASIVSSDYFGEKRGQSWNRGRLWVGQSDQDAQRPGRTMPLKCFMNQAPERFFILSQPDRIARRTCYGTPNIRGLRNGRKMQSPIYTVASPPTQDVGIAFFWIIRPHCYLPDSRDISCPTLQSAVSSSSGSRPLLPGQYHSRNPLAESENSHPGGQHAKSAFSTGSSREAAPLAPFPGFLPSSLRREAAWGVPDQRPSISPDSDMSVLLYTIIGRFQPCRTGRYRIL